MGEFVKKKLSIAVIGATGKSGRAIISGLANRTELADKIDTIYLVRKDRETALQAFRENAEYNSLEASIQDFEKEYNISSQKGAMLAQAFSTAHPKINFEPCGLEEALEVSDVTIITLDHPINPSYIKNCIKQKTPVSRMELGKNNARMIKMMKRQLSRYKNHFAVYSNHVNVLCTMLQKITGLEPEQISGVLWSDTMTLHHELRTQFGADDVQNAYVLGTHDENLAICMQKALIDNVPLQEYKNSEKVGDISKRVVDARQDEVRVLGDTASSAPVAVLEHMDAIINNRSGFVAAVYSDFSRKIFDDGLEKPSTPIYLGMPVSFENLRASFSKDAEELFESMPESEKRKFYDSASVVEKAVKEIVAEKASARTLKDDRGRWQRLFNSASSSYDSFKNSVYGMNANFAPALKMVDAFYELDLIDCDAVANNILLKPEKEIIFSNKTVSTPEHFLLKMEKEKKSFEGNPWFEWLAAKFYKIHADWYRTMADTHSDGNLGFITVPKEVAIDHFMKDCYGNSQHSENRFRMAHQIMPESDFFFIEFMNQIFLRDPSYVVDKVAQRLFKENKPALYFFLGELYERQGSKITALNFYTKGFKVLKEKSILPFQIVHNLPFVGTEEPGDLADEIRDYYKQFEERHGRR